MEPVYLFLGGPKKAMKDRLNVLLAEYKKKPGKFIVTGLIEEIDFYTKALSSIKNDLILKHSYDAYSSIEETKISLNEMYLITAAGVYYKKRLQKIVSYFGIRGEILDSHEKESWTARFLYLFYSTPWGMKVMSFIAQVIR